MVDKLHYPTKDKGLTWGTVVLCFLGIVSIITMVLFLFSNPTHAPIYTCLLAAFLVTIIGGAVLLVVGVIILMLIEVLVEHWHDKVF